MKRILFILIMSSVTVAALIYAGDYVVLRVRMAKNWNALGSVTVRSYYAVQEKNGRTEYIFNGSGEQPCVHSLFAHAGYAACWYLARHAEQQITI